VSQLSFRCRHNYAGGFSLDVAFETAHQVTSLFGPSGSGKTTILSLIAGLQVPESGRIELGTRVLVDTARRVCLAAERRRVGLVFQDLLLFPHLTVEKNLRYGERRHHGGLAIEFAQVVEVLELGDLLRRMPRKLSGGERQRVALGRALLGGPELLLLDEPLAALDAPLKDRILTYLERIVKHWSVPTIYVSHSPAEVRRLAEWAIVLENGRVVGAGPPSDVIGDAPGGI
jgi:molybdate transport system ATP-binding protein